MQLSALATRRKFGSKQHIQLFSFPAHRYGKIQLFMGGVGQDGHIAFNEPGSSLASRTRIKTLVRSTRLANSRFFDNDISKVPTQALTIGIGTFLESVELLVLCTGHTKAHAVKQAVEKGVNHLWTVSCIQLHPKAVMMIDESAAEELSLKTFKYFHEIETENVKQLLANFSA